MGKTFSEVRLQSLGEGNYDMGEMEGIKKIRQTRNEMDGQYEEISGKLMGQKSVKNETESIN